MNFVIEVITWASHTGSGWVTALDHEIRNDPVEDHAVVKGGSLWLWSALWVGPLNGSIAKSDEVLNGLGCV